MTNPVRLTPMEDLPKPDPISIRTARGRFGSLVDKVADEGRPALICRRTMPLAVLLPAAQYEELAETVRRDQSLAVFRARGIAVEAWTTAGVLEAVVRLIEGPQR